MDNLILERIAPDLQRAVSRAYVDEFGYWVELKPAWECLGEAIIHTDSLIAVEVYAACIKRRKVISLPVWDTGVWGA